MFFLLLNLFSRIGLMNFPKTDVVL